MGVSQVYVRACRRCNAHAMSYVWHRTVAVVAKDTASAEAAAFDSQRAAGTVIVIIVFVVVIVVVIEQRES